MRRRECVKVPTLGGIDNSTQVAQHVYRECQVIISVNIVRRASYTVLLTKKIREKKPKWYKKYPKE